MESKKHKTRRQVTSRPPQEEKVETQHEVAQPKPEELLLRWINLRCELQLGKELYDHTFDHRPGEKGDKTFMDEADIVEILKQVGYDFTIVTTIMHAAYHGRFQNPYTVLNAIEYDGVIFDTLADYFEKNSPERWNIGFCELIAACHDNSYKCREECEWRKDQEKVRINFKSFVQGQISPSLHSDRLYIFLFRLFFGHGSAASFVLARLDLDDADEASLMQGLIEKGKKGIFPWDFEKYLPSNK